MVYTYIRVSRWIASTCSCGGVRPSRVRNWSFVLRLLTGKCGVWNIAEQSGYIIMKKKCNLSHCYFHNYKDKHLFFALARTGIRYWTESPSHPPLFSQGHWRQSCGWLSMDYFLCPQYHSHAKPCEIFSSSFLLYTVVYFITHHPCVCHLCPFGKAVIMLCSL